MNTHNTKDIPHTDLIIMNNLEDAFPIKTDLIYGQNTALNIFGNIYTPQSKTILHKDLAKIVLLSSQITHQKHGLTTRIYDGLRTVDAQEKMRTSQAAQDNPHWLEEPNRLLSPPGGGGHPRGMAVDLTLQRPDGTLLDMGTSFDHFSEDASAEQNPAHRDHPYLSTEIINNRNILTNAMMNAANILGLPLLPLPQEWWDFRLTSDIYSQYNPISDYDLPPLLRMTEINIDANTSILYTDDTAYDAIRTNMVQDIKQSVGHAFDQYNDDQLRSAPPSKAGPQIS